MSDDPIAKLKKLRAAFQAKYLAKFLVAKQKFHVWNEARKAKLAARGDVGLKSTSQALLRGVRSQDPVVQRMSILFWFSLLGFLILAGVTTRETLIRWRQRADNQALAALIAEAPDLPILHWAQFDGVEGARKRMMELRNKAKERDVKERTLSLGEFQVEMAPLPGAVPYRGVLQLAQLELTIECDKVETCTFLSTHLIQVKNEITNALTPLDRREVMTSDGKRRVKRSIISRVNKWIGTQNESGQLSEVYIVKLLVS